MYNILLLVCLYLYFSCLLWFVVCNVFLLTLGCCGGHTNAAISSILLVYVVYLYCCIGFGCLLCFVGFMLACRDTNAAMGKVFSSCFPVPTNNLPKTLGTSCKVSVEWGLACYMQMQRQIQIQRLRQIQRLLPSSHLQPFKDLGHQL